jgi:hypothetical protein
MLFLAVTAGFFVENQREHFVEKQRAKQYIKSFYEDLKTDTVRLNNLIRFEAKKITSLNVLQSCYDSLLKNKTPVSLLNVIKNSQSNNPFRLNRRTLNQLANAGGFRLLLKEDADSIISYETRGTNLEGYQETLYQQSQDILRNTFNEIVDFIPYSNLYTDVTNTATPDVNEIKEPLFLSANKVLLNKYFNELFQYLRVTVQHRAGLGRLNENATRLLLYFKKKYNLE